MEWILRCAMLICLAAGVATAQERVDVELVLAVDVSRSMDMDELRLQREGYAEALENPALASALQAGPLGRVALLYFEWGGDGVQQILIDWRILETAADAQAMAALLRAYPVGGLRGTSISGALELGAAEIERNGIEGARRIIDVSGDGPNNRGRRVDIVRDEVAAKGIEINGLPIMMKRAVGPFTLDDLDIYYEDCVITGESAFVIPVFDQDRMAGAIRRKLVLEIAGLQPRARARLRRVVLTDCLIV